MTIVVLVGNPRAGSRTRKLAEAVGSAIQDRLDSRDHEVGVLDLAEIVRVHFGSDPACDTSGPTPAHDADEGRDPFTTVREARLLIVATPAYKGTFTGLLKVFLDRFGHQQLAGVTAVPVAVAGSATHADATATALRDVLRELGAEVVAPLSVLEADLGDGPRIAERWADDHTATLVRSLTAPHGEPA
ncbi:MAG: NAD(P)H-dependent oxidoreductase [Hamadaea sp.]|nr:NAD(P)H-dependent oxidoreductase [Hamadaea sp.]